MSWRQIVDSAHRAGKIVPDYFVYTASWVNLLANATTQVITPVTADSDFVLDEMNLAAYTAAGVLLVAPDYLITLVDQGSGRNLQDNPIHTQNVTGIGQLPFVLPDIKLFKGGGAIACTLTNNTAVAARVDLAYVGRKIFYQPGYTREMLLSGVY